MKGYKLRDLRASHTLGWSWYWKRIPLRILCFVFLKNKIAVQFGNVEKGIEEYKSIREKKINVNCITSVRLSTLRRPHLAGKKKQVS
jgi:hypothetical protein